MRPAALFDQPLLLVRTCSGTSTAIAPSCSWLHTKRQPVASLEIIVFCVGAEATDPGRHLECYTWRDRKRGCFGHHICKRSANEKMQSDEVRLTQSFDTILLCGCLHGTWSRNSDGDRDGSSL